MLACPYDARYFHEGSGTVHKCTLCNHRVDKGDVPACVETCPSKVRVFGDLEDPTSRIHELLSTRRHRVKEPQTGNGPHLFYLL